LNSIINHHLTFSNYLAKDAAINLQEHAAIINLQLAHELAAEFHSLTITEASFACFAYFASFEEEFGYSSLAFPFAFKQEGVMLVAYCSVVAAVVILLVSISNLISHVHNGICLHISNFPFFQNVCRASSCSFRNFSRLGFDCYIYSGFNDYYIHQSFIF